MHRRSFLRVAFVFLTLGVMAAPVLAAEHPIAVNQTVQAQPGDTFTFVPPSASTQYHFEVVPANPAIIVGIYRGPIKPGDGVARSKPGLSYVDHVCGAGNFNIEVLGAPGPYTIKCTANSWWYRVFGHWFGG